MNESKSIDVPVFHFLLRSDHYVHVMENPNMYYIYMNKRPEFCYKVRINNQLCCTHFE